MEPIERNIVVHGNSLAITIPSNILKALNLKAGDSVFVPFHEFKKADDKDIENRIKEELNKDIRVDLVKINSYGGKKNPRVNIVVQFSNWTDKLIEIEDIECDISCGAWVEGFLGWSTQKGSCIIPSRQDTYIAIPWLIDYYRLRLIAEEKDIHWRIGVTYVARYMGISQKFLRRKEDQTSKAEFAKWLEEWDVSF